MGYAFAVLSFSAPVYGCARPAAKGVNMFPQMMAASRTSGGGGKLCLPKLYECDEQVRSLSFELALFNAIVLQCEWQDLGVTQDDRESCGKVVMGVRNALWLIAGREGEFERGRVPLRFKEYAKPLDEGGFGVSLGKKPQGGSLSQQKVQSTALKLRTAVDDHKFMRSARWTEFREDCDELHTVLLAKLEAMKAAATSEAERREANVDKSADIGSKLIEPNLQWHRSEVRSARSAPDADARL